MKVDLKGIMLSDISLTEVDKYHRYLESKKPEKKKPTKLIDTENRLVIARLRGCRHKRNKWRGSQAKTSSYEVNKSWGRNVQHADWLIHLYCLCASCWEDKSLKFLLWEKKKKG